MDVTAFHLLLKAHLKYFDITAETSSLTLKVQTLWKVVCCQ